MNNCDITYNEALNKSAMELAVFFAEKHCTKKVQKELLWAHVIKHWGEVYKDGPTALLGPGSCALCQYYVSSPLTYCIDVEGTKCPISSYSGNYGCRCTPYTEIISHVTYYTKTLLSVEEDYLELRLSKLQRSFRKVVSKELKFLLRVRDKNLAGEL